MLNETEPFICNNTTVTTNTTSKSMENRTTTANEIAVKC